MIKFINIGYGAMVAANRIVSICNPDTAPIKRMIKTAEENNLVQDATFGRRARAVLLMDNGVFILSAVNPETLVQRIHGMTMDDSESSDD